MGEFRRKQQYSLKQKLYAAQQLEQDALERKRELFARRSASAKKAAATRKARLETFHQNIGEESLRPWF